MAGNSQPITMCSHLAVDEVDIGVGLTPPESAWRPAIPLEMGMVPVALLGGQGPSQGP